MTKLFTAMFHIKPMFFYILYLVKKMLKRTMLICFYGKIYLEYKCQCIFFRVNKTVIKLADRP